MSGVCEGPQPGAVVLPNCPAAVKCERLSPRLMQGQSHISTFRNAAVVKLVISKQADVANPHESK